MSDVLDEVLEWNSLRDVQRALDFVHGIKPANPLGIRDRNRHSTFAPGREVAFRRRMQGVQSQPVFAERIAASRIACASRYLKCCGAQKISTEEKPACAISPSSAEPSGWFTNRYVDRMRC